MIKPASPPQQPMTFRHAGDAGDIIYALPAIKYFGRGLLYIESAPYTRVAMTPDKWNGLDLLLKAQPYIADVKPWNREATDWNCNDFRSIMVRQLRQGIGKDRHLSDWLALAFRIPLTIKDEPWLAVEPNRIARVVINRAGAGRPAHQQYYGKDFPWGRVLEKYGKDAVFVGTKLEHEVFCAAQGKIPYYPTATLLEAARVIAGARLFVGNQSACFGICSGLKKPCVLEVWHSGPNVLDGRPGAVMGWDHNVELPDLVDCFPVAGTNEPTPPPIEITTETKDQPMAEPPSETSRYRHLVAHLCTGNGADLGSAGDPVVEHAINVDLPEKDYARYNVTRPKAVIQWRGTALDLPFKDGTLDWLNCLKPGSLIRTKRGMLPVEAVREGDEVQSLGDWKTVTAVKISPHSGALVTIRCHRLPFTLSLTDNHRVMVWDNGSPKFVEASHLKQEDTLISPIDPVTEDRIILRIRDLLPANNPNYQRVIDLMAAGLKIDPISNLTGIPRSTVWQYMTSRRTPHDCFVEHDGWVGSSIKTVPVKAIVPADERLMRLIGFYISDGCASIGPHSVTFYFGKNEGAFGQETIQLMSELFGVSPVKQAFATKGNIYHIRYCSKILWHVFRSLGGVPRGKYIAEWIMRLPQVKQMALIGGLVAGDGSVNKDATDASYATSNVSLAMQVRELMLRCGMASSLFIQKSNSVIKGRKIISKSLYVVKVGGINAETVGVASGKLRDRPKYRLPHYKQVGRIFSQSVFGLPIRAIGREDYEGPVFDLCLASRTETGRVFSANGILVHNSSHLLEDFPLDQWQSILNEWSRVLKPGAHLIISLPSHLRFRAAVSRGQGDNLSHRHESEPGELTGFLAPMGYDVLRDSFVTDHPYEYSILVVARKK